MVASSQVLPLKHALKLIAGEGVHELTLEAPVPIFCVAVEADARVAFLESRESAAILTTREVQDGGRAQSLATYRCERLGMKNRSCPTLPLSPLQSDAS